MPHPLRTQFLAAALIVLGGACSVAQSDPARASAVDAAPTLSVNPAAWTFNAGNAGHTFEATLLHTTATLTWSVAPSLGIVSPTAGTIVTYTPPASVDVDTVVTLTVSGAGLTAAARLTVRTLNPSLTVRPPTASTSAGGSTIPFDADLANTTGTISWALSEVIGSISPSTGIRVTYTPPPSVDADTVVTLTATKGALSDTAVITVRKPGAPPPANVVNHTNFDPGGIPTSYLDIVRTMDIFFQHKSVGSDMTHGMEALAINNPARYAISLIGWNHGGNWGAGWTANTPPAEWFDANYWSASYPYPGNAQYPTTGALANSEDGQSRCARSKTLTFDQTMRGLPISYDCPGEPAATNASNVSGEYGAHVDIAMMKFCFLEIWDPSGSGSVILNSYYRPTMEALIRDYPAVKFVWMTMALPFVQNQTVSSQTNALVAVNFNAALRTYIAQNGGLLYDVAAMESHELDGTECHDANGNPAVCTTWAYGATDSHMNAAGQVHLGLGLWSVLARAAGYTP